MNKELEKVEEKTKELATEVEKQEYQLTMEDIKKYINQDLTDKELFLAFNIIRENGLNIFKKEAHITKYKLRDGTEKFAVIVGYEVYLKRAERTGKMDGWECKMSDDKSNARVIIYRKDYNKPFIWECAMKEFNKGQSTWLSMPEFMLKKVAVAQAFRLCFPDEMGGLPYIQEEQQVMEMQEKQLYEPVKVDIDITPIKETPEKERKEKLAELEKKIGEDFKKLCVKIKEKLNIKTPIKSAPEEFYKRFIENLEKEISKK